VKDLIDEGEEHIKDIDAKIPKDLRTVKEDIRKRYIKLKFMISEYYRDHNAKTDTRNQIKDYLEKSSKSLKRLANVNLATDDDAEIKKLEDEKQILSSMIKRVKNEIAITHNGSENMLDRLKKIYELSADNKFNLLEYYNKLETLWVLLERFTVTGGDVSMIIKDALNYTDGQDELMNAVCKDLLSNRHTSKNLITSSQIEKYFKTNKEKIYRQCFRRKEKTAFGIFEKVMFYSYYYTLMDRLMFQKKYAVPHIVKNDSKLSRDIRLLNYIEEALEEGNIEESHVFVTHLSSGMRDNMYEFIELCESWMKYRISIQTIRDHSANLLATNLGMDNKK